jgi:hypothetical protein
LPSSSSFAVMGIVGPRVNVNNIYITKALEGPCQAVRKLNWGPMIAAPDAAVKFWPSERSPPPRGSVEAEPAQVNQYGSFEQLFRRHRQLAARGISAGE